MLVTGRDASRLLSGVVPTREHARLLLRAGFAGPCLRTSCALLYDESAVRALAARPLVDEDELASAGPHGLYVARLGRATTVDLTEPWARVAEQVAQQPSMPSLTRSLVAVRVAHYGHLPWVATLFGFVAICADAVEVRHLADGGTHFGLELPGSWSETVVGRRFPTRRGRPWLLWTPRAVNAPAGR
jgi:hypothetical protein